MQLRSHKVYKTANKKKTHFQQDTLTLRSKLACKEKMSEKGIKEENKWKTKTPVIPQNKMHEAE